MTFRIGTAPRQVLGAVGREAGGGGEQKLQRTRDVKAA